MSLGEYSRRKRRSANWRLVQGLLLILLMVFGVAYAYQVGVAAREANTETLEADLQRYQERYLELRDELALALQRQRDVEATLTELRQRYESDVPQGVLAELLGQIEQQLGQGVGADRIAFLIEAAGAPAACAGEPVTKRFVVRTPLSQANQAPVSAVRFDERIVVTGRGASAINASGLPEAWFDPAEPVRMEFRAPSGELATVEGTLPLYHSMIADGREYRFALIPGERAFVEVTAQACALPDVPTEVATESG